MANTDESDIHGWKYPTTGYDSDLEGRPFGEFFSDLFGGDLDIAVEKRGDVAQASEITAPPKAGAKFFADDGTVYRGTGTTWSKVPSTGPNAHVSAIPGFADTIVKTKGGLESAFNNLEAGDTIIIGDSGAPYRTEQWLDIDVNDVTIIGRGSKPLIKPADNANVGGIRVGTNAHAENVVIDGVSYHGNSDFQDQTVKRLHGFVVEDAAHVTVRNCFATRPSPRQEHGTGGSGISVRNTAQYVTLFNNWVDDTGDRGIQVAGENIQIVKNVCTNGYDRSFALTVSQPGMTNYGASNVIVHGNIGYNNSDGSIIGAGGDTPSPAKQIIISNNIGFGQHRGMITLFADFQELIITGNYADGTSSIVDGFEIGRERAPMDVPDVTVADNIIKGYDQHGITIEQGSFHAKVSGNIIKSPGTNGINVEGSGTNYPTIVGNSITGAGLHGIFLKDGINGATIGKNAVVNSAVNGVHIGGSSLQTSVTGNAITRAGQHGIHVGGTAKYIGVSNNAIDFCDERGISHSATGSMALMGNIFSRNSEAAAGTHPAILLSGGEVVALGNVVHEGNHSHGIQEEAGAIRSLLVGNYVSPGSAGTPFSIASPETVTKSNYPAIDVHPGLAPAGGTVDVTFDRPYAAKPFLDINTEAVAMTGITAWSTDASGNYTGATIAFENATGAVNPTTHVNVTPRT